MEWIKRTTPRPRERQQKEVDFEGAMPSSFPLYYIMNRDESQYKSEASFSRQGVMIPPYSRDIVIIPADGDEPIRSRCDIWTVFVVSLCCLFFFSFSTRWLLLFSRRSLTRK